MRASIEGAAKSLLTTPSDREVRVERVFDASRDRVWRAFTEPELVAQWWGRGNKLVIERMEVDRGGHWRSSSTPMTECTDFEGRYREVTPIERLVWTFDWDGMPGHVAIDTTTLEELADGRTKVISHSLFHTASECDGMLAAGMQTGLDESYAALDRLLAGLG